MKQKKCPKCGSEKIKIIDYLDLKCIKCGNCDYDETAQYEVYPSEKTSQKAKGHYNPYKTGGPRRTEK